MKLVRINRQKGDPVWVNPKYVIEVASGLAPADGVGYHRGMSVEQMSAAPPIDKVEVTRVTIDMPNRWGASSSTTYVTLEPIEAVVVRLTGEALMTDDIAPRQRLDVRVMAELAPTSHDAIARARIEATDQLGATDLEYVKVGFVSPNFTDDGVSYWLVTFTGRHA